MSKLSVRTKFAYGVGQVGEQIKIVGFDLFVFFYFQQVLGLSGFLAGAAVAIALVFDAVTDPLAGELSDNWHSPRGRRHPFMYAAALPLALSWFGLFFPPAGLGQFALFLWLTLFAILVRASMTLYHVPHMAMGAEITDDYVERTSVVAWRVFFGVVGGVLMSAVALALFFPRSEEYQNGLLNPAGYPRVALFGAILMAGTIWYSAWGTRDQIARMPKAPPQREARPLSKVLFGVWGGYREAAKLLSFRSVFGGAACFTIAYGITQTLQTHVAVFFYEFSAKQQALLRLALLPGFFLGIALTRWAHRRFEKRATAMYGMLGLTVALHTPIVLRLLGVLPHNGSGSLLAVVAFFLMLVGATAGLAITTASSMMADVTQEYEVASGRSQQGVLFSAVSLAQKLGSASGHVVAGVGLDLITFPTQETDPSAVDPSLITGLGLLYLTAGLISLGGVYSYSRYDLTRKRQEETLAAMLERRAQRDAREDAERAAATPAAEMTGSAEREPAS